MIVRKNLKLSAVFRYSWRRTAYAVACAIAAVVLVEGLGVQGFALPFVTVSAMSTALAIFLGFHNNASYDRWWEARKLWGQLINSSRSFTRQVFSLVDSPAPRRALVYRQIAFAHALRLHLRKQRELLPELAAFLPAREYERVVHSSNPPMFILQAQAEHLAALRAEGALSELRHLQLDQTLTEFSNVQGGCERIKNTPPPRQYEFYTRLFVFFYCSVLPFALVDSLHWRTGLFSVPVSFLFYALEGVATVNEDPFENRLQDTPMTALSRTIEINLRDALGETGLPPALEPVDGFLL
jgi:putative membrane protein